MADRYCATYDGASSAIAQLSRTLEVTGEGQKRVRRERREKKERIR